MLGLKVDGEGMKAFSFWATLVVAAQGSTGCGLTERDASDDRAPEVVPSAEPKDPGPDDADVAKNRHLLMVIEVEPVQRVGRTLVSRLVDQPLPRLRGAPKEQPWRAEVLGESGAVLYVTTLPDAGKVRGEFADDKGRWSRVDIDQAMTAASLRLPLLEAARVVRLVATDGPHGDTELARVDYPRGLL